VFRKAVARRPRDGGVVVEAPPAPPAAVDAQVAARPQHVPHRQRQQPQRPRCSDTRCI
jgi:hypothetical protein